MRLADVKTLWRRSVAPALTPPASVGTIDEAVALLCDQGRAYVGGGVLHLAPQHLLRYVAPLVDQRLSRGSAQKLVVAHLQASGRLPPASRALLFGGKVPPEGQRLLEGVPTQGARTRGLARRSTPRFLLKPLTGYNAPCSPRASALTSPPFESPRVGR